MRRRALPIFLGLLLCSQTKAGLITLDFESLTDLEQVTSQFSGLTFQNTIAFASGTIGGTLNEFEFLPQSGFIVVSDDGGPITITFATPVLSLSGYFTYLAPVTLMAFDGGSNQVGQVVSAFNNNLALSGDPGSSSNELLSVAFAAGIASVTIAGDQFGGSFTLDDLTLETPDEVPEPASILLSLTALGTLIGFRRHSTRNQ